MAFTCGLYLLVIWVLSSHNEVQPAPSKPDWKSPKFPCEVLDSDNSQVIFDCRGRRLKKVPDGITENVTKLDLSENFLQEISSDTFSNLQNLTHLNLNWANKINELKIHPKAFKNLTKLCHLSLVGTRQNKIPENVPLSVNDLNLNSNNITSLSNESFVGLGNLTHLLLSKNCYMWTPCGKYFIIEKNSFTPMTKLQTLDLSFNNITEVPKGLPQTLANLSLGSNRIQIINKEDFSALRNLKELKIQGNCPRCQNAPYPCVPCKGTFLHIHPDAFQTLTQLEELNLGGNSLEYLNPSWFESLGNLKQLLLSFNFLMDTITGAKPFPGNLPKLERLDLSFNFQLKQYPISVNLSSEFSKLTSLKTLHMEGLVFQNIENDTLRPLYGLKNLTALNLGTNFIIHSDSSVFQQMQHVRMIYLAENRLFPISQGPNSNRINRYTQGFSNPSFSPVLNPHPTDIVYELTHGYIKEECFNSGQVLVLSSNNLFFISPDQFNGYGNISCLNLSKNGFSAALKGTEFSLLPNLTYLDLSFNKLDLAYSQAFSELKKLEVLDISFNSHYFSAYGITQNLNFTKNLPVLRVLNMSSNAISTLTTKEMYSESIAELRFAHNFLGILWKENDKTYENLFFHLTNLTNLDISYNDIKKIPENVYKTLPCNLTILCIKHNALREFRWDQLIHFPRLQSLDLSYNSLSDVSGINSSISQTLSFLDLSHNHIFQLETGFANGPKSLETLILSYNRLTLINQSSFQPGPENHIRTLYLWKNPFQCTCDSFDFIIWLENSNLQNLSLPRLTTRVTCDTPVDKKGNALINFDINQCVNDSLAFSLYIFTSFLTLVTLFFATVAHLFFWDVSYVLYYVKAKLKGYKPLNSVNSTYDLFVTYDTRDEHVSDWVMKNLRVKLEEEGEKHLPLCLEERDWMPGVPILENLSYSIKYSRKTLFVLTKGYVKTGIFRLAMYMAHQRLLDENEDVIVLLMLEPVLQHSHFLRLRRRLCGKSVVDWPKTAAAEPWFWQNLRNVVRTDNQVMYNKTYSKCFTGK